jgi:hypothetical protein
MVPVERGRRPVDRRLVTVRGSAFAVGGSLGAHFPRVLDRRFVFALPRRLRALTLLGRPIASTGGSVSRRGDNLSLSRGLVAT